MIAYYSIVGYFCPIFLMDKIDRLSKNLRCGHNVKKDKLKMNNIQ